LRPGLAYAGYGPSSDGDGECPADGMMSFSILSLVLTSFSARVRTRSANDAVVHTPPVYETART
jgi:hypothetical protein